jgi:hypothetical protein
MNGFIARAGLIAASIGTAIVSASIAHSAPKAKVHRASVQATESEVRRSGFSGNEMQLGLFWWVNPDCSSSQRPDVRIVKAPSHGEMTFKEVFSVVEIRGGHPRARCNGQPVAAVGMFYTSNEDFTGQERLTVDIDYRDGSVRRQTVVVDVR